jgi:hypothetical protein
MAGGRATVATGGPGPYIRRHVRPCAIPRSNPMNAEQEKLVGDIKQSLTLLRRSL